MVTINRKIRVSKNTFKIGGAFLFILLMTVHSIGQADQDSLEKNLLVEGQNTWVDSVYQAMTLEEKIGQLFMIRAFARDKKGDVEEISRQVKEYGVGGICFFQGDPKKLAKLNNKYQNESKIPMLISIDGEWGLGMRYPYSTISFPRALTLGAIQDNNLIHEMGGHIADHCQRVGIHVNFGPVVDVNNNPDNPVINNRSFGENKFNVAAKGYEYMTGMQENGVMACAKHFPGHGDTDVDSHYDLPVITHDRARLDSIELMPFRSMIKRGIGSIMIAHLNIPALDDRKNRPTTLSHNTVTGLLKEEMGFTGLIFTDAMEMKGVRKHFTPGEADKEAFLAGNDIILLPKDIKAGIESIKTGILDKTVPYARLEHSVKKILKAKYVQGLTKWNDINLIGIQEDLNNKESIALKEKLVENAITLVKDEEEIVPIRKIHDTKFASISIGEKEETVFQKKLSKYVDITNTQMPKLATGAIRGATLAKVKDAEYVIVGFYDMSKYAKKKFGINPTSIDFLRMLIKEKKVIIVLFGSPYALKYFDEFPTVIVAYEEDDMFQDIAAQSLFGANAIKGKLPITASETYNYGMGEYRGSLGRLGYSVPERVGMSSKTLAGIDSIVEEMIRKKAAPGCQVLVAKDGKIVFEKPYGYFTYEKERPVKLDDIYDMASVTKTCASTISLMKLSDDRLFSIEGKLLDYIPEIDTCNKAGLNIKKILAHHGQLAGWIPFYKKTVSDNKRNPTPLLKYYREAQNDSFSIKVAENLFLRTDYQDSIWSRIYGSQLKERKGYRYSDLAFYFMHRSVKNITGKPINDYAMETFYKPLGLRRTQYLPLAKFNVDEIAPSEDDTYFRNQIIQGHVHDMGAAMLGGVSGHAGLFSNANEIATIFQMLLNGGSYGGKKYLNPETIKTFTTRFEESTRRGIGFDMKELNTKRSENMSPLASDATYGHLGFTGIAAFADPKHDLIYIFISNRTFPTMNNRKFGRGEYRPRIQSQIYKALELERKCYPN